MTHLYKVDIGGGGRGGIIYGRQNYKFLVNSYLIYVLILISL